MVGVCFVHMHTGIAVSTVQFMPLVTMKANTSMQSLLDDELLCCSLADTAPLAEGDQNEQEAD